MENAPIHRFRNNAKAIPIGDQGFQHAYEHGVLELSVFGVGDDRVEETQGHRRFVNLCQCSYLGLHQHPKIIESAIDAIRREGSLFLSIGRVRIRPKLVDDVEAGLGQLFRTRAIATLSCSAATAGVLPLLASGHLTDDGQPRVMVFDRSAHFSMALIKPICADETTVLTAPHNDMNFVEDACKKYPRVAYVADGAYSTGGVTDLKALLELQDRYGLFLYFDDSHSLSIWGDHGEGYVRSQIPGDSLNPLTIIVSSLGKAFGANGGVVMLGPVKHEHTLIRFGGPITWSQSQNVPTLGACLGAIEVHNSPELGELQRKLRDHLKLFDERIPTSEQGTDLPIRVVRVGEEERATSLSGVMLDRGFYTSAVFFPIVERGRAGLRAMMRADNNPEDILAFCDAIRDVVSID